jgi:chromosome segregation ATPase
MNDFNPAIQTLEKTIGSITTKVNEQKDRANEYKAYIIRKLGELSGKIQNLRALGSCDPLKQEIASLKQQLQAKTDELTTANNSASACQAQITNLQREIDALKSQIAEKDAQIQQLTSDAGNKDAEIARLTNEKQALEAQKQEVENNLASVNERMSSEITSVNNRLQEQIRLIDTIMDELANERNKGVMDQEFQQINNNIDDIIRTVNSGSGPGQAGNVRNLVNQFENRTASSSFKTGGKRKTRKHQRKRMGKQIGGYVYSTSAKLDKSSSIITGSSKAKSAKRSKKT